MFKIMKIIASVALALCAQASMAQAFNSGIPAGWTCTGNCGTLGANGVVSLSPASGSTAYGWVSTSGGVYGVSPYSTGVETNGSTLVSTSFSANAGDPLKFYFNYVTSDGAGFSDYGWSVLRDANTNAIVANLFDARTTPSGNTVPGFGLPAITASLVPASTPIIPGGVSWAPLNPNNSPCYSGGCGYTSWIEASYTIPTAGSYKIEFGTINSLDTAWNSGMAFDGITVNNVVIGNPVPEPETYALLMAGLGLMSFVARRRKQNAA